MKEIIEDERYLVQTSANKTKTRAELSTLDAGGRVQHPPLAQQQNGLD